MRSHSPAQWRADALSATKAKQLFTIKGDLAVALFYFPHSDKLSHRYTVAYLNLRRRLSAIIAINYMPSPAGEGGPLAVDEVFELHGCILKLKP